MQDGPGGRGESPAGQGPRPQCGPVQHRDPRLRDAGKTPRSRGRPQQSDDPLWMRSRYLHLQHPDPRPLPSREPGLGRPAAPRDGAEGLPPQRHLLHDPVARPLQTPPVERRGGDPGGDVLQGPELEWHRLQHPGVEPVQGREDRGGAGDGPEDEGEGPQARHLHLQLPDPRPVQGEPSGGGPRSIRGPAAGGRRGEHGDVQHADSGLHRERRVARGPTPGGRDDAPRLPSGRHNVQRADEGALHGRRRRERAGGAREDDRAGSGAKQRLL